VPVVCTSGTAAAAMHPAVLEADVGSVPLLVLTADRPPELRGIGASQTVDQIGLFGRAVRMFVEVGVPQPVVGQVSYWRSLVGRAVAAATGTSAGGPVHLNLAFREPLVPEDDEDLSWPEPLDGREDDAAWVWRDRWEPASMPVSELLGDSIPERGAVLAGDGVVTPSSVVGMAKNLGWPLFAEPTSNSRYGPNVIDGYPLLLDEELMGIDPPDVVFTVGRPGLSRSLLRWLGRAGTQIVMDSTALYPDPTRTACRVLPRPPFFDLDPAEPTEWLRAWQHAGRAAAAVLDAEADAARLTEVGVARVLGAALPAGGLLVCGPSRPIRDVDLTLPARDDITVVANRGVNGIDGVVSTAIGAALGHQRVCHGGQAIALIGDLTYLYDRNGLLLAAEDPRPDLVLVVVDNDGGGIFHTLPQAGLPGFERVFGTPHGLDLCADAAVAGIPATTVTSRAELEDAIKPARGLRLVRVPADRAETAAALADLHQRVGMALKQA
jgi:2-succinyl-5-enolpyruvyl-6-hydroxy-3-cyclohexene-1-carboxylate synthase